MKIGQSSCELIIVSAITVAVSCLLWWRFLPLPHPDLSSYTEPAYLLARFGTLAAPGSQYIDLTYQKGAYFYPPGYFILMAGWLKLFGLSPDSLLAYTHVVHSGAIILLWQLLRKRYSCSRPISALVLVAFFPRMAHGRPDLTAAFLSLVAWASLPEELNWTRIVLSGCLGGATLLVSPGFGVAIIATLVILILANVSIPLSMRLRASVVWLGTAGTLVGATLAALLTAQHSWTIAYVQFKTNVAVRGSELNLMPNLRLPFTWIFSIVPFVMVAIVPAIAAVGWEYKNRASQVRAVGIAFLGSITIWLAMNKSQLLLDHHFLCPSKSVFLGVVFSWLRWPRWARLTPLLLLGLIGFYYYKSDFLYLASPLREEERSYAATARPKGLAAVDSPYFARFYRPGQTLNYEVAEIERYWPRYRAAIPPSVRAQLLAGLPDRPPEPTMLLFSAITRSRFREAERYVMPCEPSTSFAEQLHILGRTWNLPAKPYALTICHE